MASCKEGIVVLLKGEAILRGRICKVKISVGLRAVWKLPSAVFDTETGPNVLKVNFVPRA